MSSIFKILFCINIILYSTEAKQYNIDLLEIDWNITTPNNCDMSWRAVRPSRGVFAISGFMEFKEDINTDKATGYVYIYYSKNGMSYALTPFHIPPTIFTDGVNFFYKNYLMDTMKECCKSAIDFEDKFVAPLTKRVMDCDSCILRTDNFPTNMRLGYYKIIGISVGELSFAMTLLMKLELE